MTSSPSSPPPSSSSEAGGGKDVWRHSALRYLGYANEVGEALGVWKVLFVSKSYDLPNDPLFKSTGPVYPRVVKPSYAVAFGYVAGRESCVLLAFVTLEYVSLSKFVLLVYELL